MWFLYFDGLDRASVSRFEDAAWRPQTHHCRWEDSPKIVYLVVRNVQNLDRRVRSCWRSRSWKISQIIPTSRSPGPDLWLTHSAFVQALAAKQEESAVREEAAKSGAFHQWGYPNSWLVYNGKSQSKIDDDLGVGLFKETSILRCLSPLFDLGFWRISISYIVVICVSVISFPTNMDHENRWTWPFLRREAVFQSSKPHSGSMFVWGKVLYL